MHHGRPLKRRFNVVPRQAGGINSTSATLESVNTTLPVSTSESLSGSPASLTQTSQTTTDSSSTTSQTGVSTSNTLSSSQTPSSQVSSVESSSLSTERTTTTTPASTSSSAIRNSPLTFFIPSSSSSATSITTSLIPRPTPGPSTTLVVTTGPSSDTPTSIIGTYTFSPSATKEPASGLADGFWQNTGAVAGTFTALGVFVLGIIAAFIILRRRRARRTQSEDEFFENFAVASGNEARTSPQGASSQGHTMSPRSSLAELAARAPMDIYSDHHMYNIHPDYPPGTSHGFASMGEVASYPNYSNPQMSQASPYAVASQTQPQNQYIPPSRAVHDRQAAPRRSYQRSIDSFYGAS